MKVGAASWCFTHPYYQPPYGRLSKRWGSLGVDGIEMIAYNSDDLYGYYTDERCTELKSSLTAMGWRVSEFVLYAHAVVGLLDPDDGERDNSRFFPKGHRGGQKGANTMNIVSNWPEEIKAQWITCLNYFIRLPVENINNPKQYMEIPEDFDATWNWNRYLILWKRL